MSDKIHGLGGVHKVKGLIDESSHDATIFLDTGVRVADVVKEAREWWDARGRHEMRRHRQSACIAGKGISDDPTSENFIPSGLTCGLPWDNLGRHECVAIVKNYHHQKYRLPQREAEDAVSNIIG